MSSKLAFSISDSGWGEIVRQLDYKCLVTIVNPLRVASPSFHSPATLLHSTTEPPPSANWKQPYLIVFRSVPCRVPFPFRCATLHSTLTTHRTPLH